MTKKARKIKEQERRRERWDGGRKCASKYYANKGD